MPQHDPDDEDFWTRSRRTRQSDKASRRGKKPKEGGAKPTTDWTEATPTVDVPPAAAPPPAAPPRREPGAPPPRRSAAPPPAAAAPPPAPARSRRAEPYPADTPPPRRSRAAEPYPAEPAPPRRAPAAEPPPARRAPAVEPPPARRAPAAEAPPARRAPAVEPPPARRAPAVEPPPAHRAPAAEPPPPARRAGASEAPSRRAAAARAATPQPDVAPRGPGAAPRSSRDPFAGPETASTRPDTSRPPGAARRSSRQSTGETAAPPGRSAAPLAASSTNGPHLTGRTTPAPGADPGWTSPTPLTPSPERRATARQQAPTRAPAGRTGVRTTGENPHLDDRLEGLASRATPPQGGSRTPAGRPPAGRPPADEPLAPDPLVDQRATVAVPVYDKGYEDDSYAGDLYEDTYADDYDDGYVAATPDRSRRPGCFRSPVAIGLAVLAVLCVALLMGAFWVKGKIDPGGDPGPETRVEILAGQSTSEIGSTLEDAGVIESASVWTWYIRFKGGGDIQAGVYEIPTNLSMGDALKALEAKPLPPGTKAATIPEGLSVLQMRQRLTESDKKVEGFTPEGWDEALTDPAVRSKYIPANVQSLEGTFFPANYDLAEDATEKTLLTKMRAEFDATMDELGADAGAAALQRNAYEILIVASIIEQEARVPEDRAKIARVIYNRLAAGTPLYIDAINCYDRDPGPCNADRALFEQDSPYNSRKVKGLPPTPIASPGRASIEAALLPADGNWTFYVLDPNLPEGQHFFTDKKSEFDAAKARCEDAGLGCG